MTELLSYDEDAREEAVAYSVNPGTTYTIGVGMAQQLMWMLRDGEEED